MVSGGENCSKCEKCIRTIMGIIAEGGNPVDYGFKPDYDQMKNFMTKQVYFGNNKKILWEDIKNSFNNSKNKFINNSDVNWIYDINFEKLNKEYKRIDKIIRRKFLLFVRKIKRIKG